MKTKVHESLAILIHCALKDEAIPIVESLGLRQYETKPWIVYRSPLAVLIQTGPGATATKAGLQWILEKQNFSAAVNIGIAACKFCNYAQGTWRDFGFGDPRLLMVEKPLTEWPEGPAEWADMESAAFFAVSVDRLSVNAVRAYKVLSDYGSDNIPSKQTTRLQMSKALNNGLLLELQNMLNFEGASSNSVWQSVHKLSVYRGLGLLEKQKIRDLAVQERLSFQQLRQICEVSLDLTSWSEQHVCIQASSYAQLMHDYQALRDGVKSYNGFQGKPAIQIAEHGGTRSIDVLKKEPKLGRCPVESEKTRCCRLLTLDVVEGCAFSCSYCAIKTFYRSGSIGFYADLALNLSKLSIDPSLVYHIGTGQSSDSLLWGNQHGILEALCDFARKHPNVILELKTKSANISWLLENSVPENVLCTWSLNTELMIAQEEHGSALLSDRLAAARAIADKGIIIGFHFHPIIEYQNCQDEYAQLYYTVQEQFKPHEIAMISFGTLTFTRPVMRSLRLSGMQSKVLQMPLSEAAGKFSYPIHIREKIFSHAYQCFAPWHNQVFFYLCMEDSSLWPSVFGFSWPSNEAFEAAMLTAYTNRIQTKRNGVNV
jgi:spore photoproduct lyase